MVGRDERGWLDPLSQADRDRAAIRAAVRAGLRPIKAPGCAPSQRRRQLFAHLKLALTAAPFSAVLVLLALGAGKALGLW